MNDAHIRSKNQRKVQENNNVIFIDMELLQIIDTMVKILFMNKIWSISIRIAIHLSRQEYILKVLKHEYEENN